MAQGARDQGDEEYTSHLTPDRPITPAWIVRRLLKCMDPSLHPTVRMRFIYVHRNASCHPLTLYVSTAGCHIVVRTERMVVYARSLGLTFVGNLLCWRCLRRL
jgi:hypothetical protein